MSLEQEAENASSDHELNLVDTSIVSIAISLKRIADVICRPPPIMAELTPEQEKEFSKHKYGFIVTKS